MFPPGRARLATRPVATVPPREVERRRPENKSDVLAVHTWPRGLSGRTGGHERPAYPAEVAASSSVTPPSRLTGPPPRVVRAIPDQPSRTATRSRSCIGSIGDPHGRTVLPWRRERDECSTGKVAYGEDHSRPDGAHSRLLKTAGADPAQAGYPVNPIEWVTKSA